MFLLTQFAVIITSKFSKHGKLLPIIQPHQVKINGAIKSESLYSIIYKTNR